MSVTIKHTKKSAVKKKCNKCGKNLSVNLHFYKIAEPDPHFPDGTVNVCKTCLKEDWEDELTGFRAFIDFLRVANLAYKSDLYNQSQDKTVYLRTIRNRVYSNLRHIDSDPLVEEKGKIQIKQKKLKSLTEEQMEECALYWGAGYKEEEYIYLLSQYDDFEKEYGLENATKTMRDIVTNIILTQLRIRQGLEAGRDVSKDNASYLKLVDAAGLKPSQEKEEAQNEANAYSNFIGMIENEEPIPAPLPEYVDVDGIAKYVKAFFMGQMAESLGEKNPYQKEYDEVMEEFSVDPEERY